MGVPEAIVAGIGLATYKQQGAIGKYNKGVNDRNALIKEQEAAQIDKQKEFDIAQFDKSFVKFVGKQDVSLAKSGVDVSSGTAYNIRLANAREAELQKDIINYNAEIGKAQKFEEAAFSRIKGNVAMQTAKLAQLKTVSDTGTSLLKMGGYFG